MRATVFAILLGASSHAAAQATPSDQERAQALAMLQAGNDAATDGDWESARVAFSRAYAIVASTRVLMNLAGAQRHTGRLLDARASYQRWLTDAVERDEPYRATVEQALTELASEIPQLTVSVTGGRPGDAVDVDGRSVATGQPLELDPGPHTVELLRGTTVIATETIDLTATDRSVVELAAPSLAPRPAPEPVHAAPLVSDHDDGDITQSPWFWVGVGGGAVVLIGIIVGIAVAASSGGTSAPDTGTLGPFGL